MYGSKKDLCVLSKKKLTKSDLLAVFVIKNKRPRGAEYVLHPA